MAKIEHQQDLVGIETGIVTGANSDEIFFRNQRLHQSAQSCIETPSWWLVHTT